MKASQRCNRGVGSRRASCSGAPVRCHRAGQAMLESLIVIFVMGIFLFGLLQAAIAFTGRQVAHHAAARAARARAVGFNDWMAFKAVRVASIPNSGRMTVPDFTPLGMSPIAGAHTPGEAVDRAVARDAGISERAAFERVRIPAYLASENYARSGYVLGYEEWERGSFRTSERSAASDGSALLYRVEQDFPLRMSMAAYIFPFARIDEAGVPRIMLGGEATAGNHSDLYLDR